MIRKIIRIDEEKCNGCGACANACHEGAIEMINGKAKLTKENYCDGLGDCLPACPANAISFEEREAPAYDEAAVKAAKTAYGKLTATQKAIVDADNYGDIADLETRIAEIKIEVKIDPVADLINDLPSATKIALEDEAAIKAARKAYNALTATEKTKFGETYATELAKLVACEGALDTLIVAEIAADAAYKAAKDAFAATELSGIVNATTYAASKDLLAKYDAVTGHAKAKFDAEENVALALIAKLRATVAAYEFYTTPAE